MLKVKNSTFRKHLVFVRQFKPQCENDLSFRVHPAVLSRLDTVDRQGREAGLARQAEHGRQLGEQGDLSSREGDAAKALLARLEQLVREPMKLPTLWLNPERKGIDDFIMDDIKLENYISHSAIKAKMIV